MSTTLSHVSRYRVAAIQYEPTPGAKEQNVVELLGLVEEAAQHDARLIVLPEMATLGYCWTARDSIAPYVEPIAGPTTVRFQRLASTYACYIALGLPEVDPTTNIYYNSMALLGPEGICGAYRKIHSSIAEPRWARDGDVGMPTWDTPLGRLGGLIGMDALYCESARIPTLHGVDVLLFPTNWLDEKCPSGWWMARALENGVYFIAANRFGLERGTQFSGGSCIINPDGSIQAYRDNGVGIVYGEVDLSACRDKRWPGTMLTAGDRVADRRPNQYSELVHNTYLWEPLRYHGLYGAGELPQGQLSCAAILQTNLHELHAPTTEGMMQLLRSLVETLMNDAAPARPDMLILPALLLPGPAPFMEAEGAQASDGLAPEEIRAHFLNGAIALPGPETHALVKLAAQFQMSIVVGVAEKDEATSSYYNSVLLIDPEGLYGVYRKLHLTVCDRLWASPGNLGLPTFDTPVGRVGLATGYDLLFPETLRVLASKGADLVCAPACLDFPAPAGLGSSSIAFQQSVAPEGFDPTHFLIWRVRANENNVYLALANWYGEWNHVNANGYSGIFPPTRNTYPWPEVIAEAGESALTMMTIDTREHRTGRRSSSQQLTYTPGDVAGSLTGELDYDVRDSIPGNVVRSKHFLRKRMPFWYLDLVNAHL